MKKRKKSILWLIAALSFLLCLVPVRQIYKDGGTVEYRALLYQVTKWHTMVGGPGNVETFREGLEIHVLGFCIYDGRHLVEARYCD